MICTSFQPGRHALQDVTKKTTPKTPTSALLPQTPYPLTSLFLSRPGGGGCVMCPLTCYVSFSHMDL